MTQFFGDEIQYSRDLLRRGSLRLRRLHLPPGGLVMSGTPGFHLRDNEKLRLGDDEDAEIYYDGTDLIVNPQAVGSGDLLIPKDNAALALGAGSGGDARMYYDGTDLVVDPSVIGSGDLLINKDTVGLALGGGSGGDARMYYDGTNAVIDPKAVGSGALDVKGDLWVDSTIRDGSGNERIDLNSRLFDSGGRWTVRLGLTVDGGNLILSSGGMNLTGPFTIVAGATPKTHVVFDPDGTHADPTALMELPNVNMKGNLAMGDKSVTGIDTLTFTDVDGTIAGIANKNLLDKAAAETITGAWTFDGAVVFNEPGADVDLRMESQSFVGMFYLDASADKIGIGNFSSSDLPEKLLHLKGDADLKFELDTGTTSATLLQYSFYVNAAHVAEIQYKRSVTPEFLALEASDRVDTSLNQLVLTYATDQIDRKIGMGTNDPQKLLHLAGDADLRFELLTAVSNANLIQFEFFVDGGHKAEMQYARTQNQLAFEVGTSTDAVLTQFVLNADGTTTLGGALTTAGYNIVCNEEQVVCYDDNAVYS